MRAESTGRGSAFALQRAMLWRLVLAFILPSIFTSLAAADCDCQKACQSRPYSEISEVGFCSKEDVDRCGVKLEMDLSSKLRTNPNPRTGERLNPQSANFLKALHQQRDLLLDIYSDMISPEEYAQLAGLAFGILGVESDYYLSERYFFKSWTPNRVINVARCLYRGNCTNPPVSEGPTQIKQIPERIVTYYGASPATLYRNPTHAAAATMGFLIELKQDLLRLKSKYPEQLKAMNDSNITDYLAYFYQGKGARIIKKGEVPDVSKNPYLKQLKEKHLASLSVKQMSCSQVFSSSLKAFGLN